MCTELNCCFKDDILAQVKTSATNPRVSPYIQGIIYIIRQPGDVKITSDETGRNTIKYHVKLIMKGNKNERITKNPTDCNRNVVFIYDYR